jgi:hypothetical protein
MRLPRVKYTILGLMIAVAGTLELRTYSQAP